MFQEQFEFLFNSRDLLPIEKSLKGFGAIIALSYVTYIPPILLLMIHHEEIRLNANANPNPKGGVGKCNSAKDFKMLVSKS